MDGYAEANLLLNTALEQLDDILAHGHRKVTEKEPLARKNNNAMNEVKAKDENGNDGPSERGKENNGWGSWSDDRRGSCASSEADSPPSDLPTSSTSSSAILSPYEAFVRAIEKRELGSDRPDLETQLKIMKWMVGEDPESPSPSMSTVSCPEYPELQDKLQRLAMARDSLSLQVAVLNEQVNAQKEKIRDLETLLIHKRNKLDSTEEIIQDRYGSRRGSSELESKKLDLMAEVSNLKLKFATMEREKQEAERKLHMSQHEMEHLNQSMQNLIPPGRNIMIPPPPLRQNYEEMEQLRHTVQRLIADNEAKNVQISCLRSALEQQHHNKSMEASYSSGRWNPQEPPYDFNTQLRKLLLDDSLDQMAHSSSFPVSLCSSQPNPPSSSRSVVQSSCSFNSSLSPSSWTQSSTPRHQISGNSSFLSNPHQSYRSPSSPAARQLAAELDELRRIGQGSANYNTTSLPRTMFTKTQSTLTLPGKKMSVASATSAGECSASVASTNRRNYRYQVNKWINEKLRRKKRSTSAPNLVESDDEIARGRLSTAASSTASSKPLKRDRTRSSLRNIFSKFSRSNSQEHSNSAFRRGSAARSTSAARLGSSGPLSGPIALRPPVDIFIDWKGEQLAEWIGEIGYPQIAPQVAAHVRSGRQMLNMTAHELESELSMRNPIHRKRLQLILRRIEKNIIEPIDKWDMHQVLRWLEDIGLPQYKDVFNENTVDGPVLMQLTVGDLVEMRVQSALHYTTIARSIQRLRKSDYKLNYLIRKFDAEILSNYPSPDLVSRWSHAATCEWLRTIDLAEFTPNLLCAGVPGAVMVYEPSFTAETLAEILQMPPHKTLLRRHLTTHFNQLLGQKIVSAKRDFLAQGHWPQLTPSIRIKVVRKGFSLTRKKAKGEICLEPEELLSSPLIDTATSSENGDGESTNV